MTKFLLTAAIAACTSATPGLAQEPRGAGAYLGVFVSYTTQPGTGLLARYKPARMIFYPDKAACQSGESGEQGQADIEWPLLVPGANPGTIAGGCVPTAANGKAPGSVLEVTQINSYGGVMFSVPAPYDTLNDCAAANIPAAGSGTLIGLPALLWPVLVQPGGAAVSGYGPYLVTYTAKDPVMGNDTVVIGCTQG